MNFRMYKPKLLFRFEITMQRGKTNQIIRPREHRNSTREGPQIFTQDHVKKNRIRRETLLPKDTNETEPCTKFRDAHVPLTLSGPRQKESHTTFSPVLIRFESFSRPQVHSNPPFLRSSPGNPCQSGKISQKAATASAKSFARGCGHRRNDSSTTSSFPTSPLEEGLVLEDKGFFSALDPDDAISPHKRTTRELSSSMC
jgi:hypothetical protein